MRPDSFAKLTRSAQYQAFVKRHEAPLNDIEVGTLGWMTALWAGSCFASIAFALCHFVWKVI